MRWTNHKVIIAAVLTCIVGVAVYTSHQSQNDIWQVVGELPTTISREKGIDTSTYYLIRQTHEPLFRCDDLQNYSSRILKRWERSIDYKKYYFYPDTTLKFNKDLPFTEEYFDCYMSSTVAAYGRGGRVSRITGGIQVVFDLPQRQFLYYLTWHENAPAIKAGKFEYGLGPFIVTQYNNEQMVLNRKEYVRNGYNKIIYHNYRGERDANLQNREIQDFNLLSTFEQPEWIKKEYLGVKNPDPRTIVLLINHPDINIRRRLHDCLDVDGFRRAFIVKRKEFHDVSTILPVGIPGGKGGLPQQTCTGNRPGLKANIVLINQRDDNDNELLGYLKKISHRAGIPISVKKMGYAELVSFLKDSKRKPFSYNLLQIVLDTFRPDQKVFFEYTAGEKSFLDIKPKSVEKLYAELLQADDAGAKKDISKQLAEELNSEGLVLPLYQTYSTIYYPKNIRNMTFGNSFSQYPEVADFRW